MNVIIVRCIYVHQTALPAEHLLGGEGGGRSGEEDDEEGGGDNGSKVTTVELEFNIDKYIER